MISGFITGLLMVASTVGVAILGLLLVRRLVPLDLLQMHHEVGGYIIGVMGTIYAVILAFVVFVVWNQYQMANAAVVAEANSLGDLSRMTRRLPEPLQTQLRGALVNYLEAVIHSEWPAMGRQSESQEAWSAMQKLWEIYRSADIPRDERAQNVLFRVAAATEQSERRSPHSFICQPRESAYPHVGLALAGRHYHPGLHLFFRCPKHSFPMPDDHSLRAGGFSEPLPDSGAGSTLQWIGANIADAT